VDRRGFWRLAFGAQLRVPAAIEQIVSDNVLSRREALARIGASSAALLTLALPARAAAPPSCFARPQQTEGPFFVEEELDRSDIRSDPRTGAVRPGVPLRLTFNVSRMSGATCVPLAGAKVDLWHCDAAGRYSDARSRGSSSVGEKFLRGYQRTNAAGTARFLTIYPGWYGGRTVHVHFKIRTAASSASARTRRQRSCGGLRGSQSFVNLSPAAASFSTAREPWPH